MKKGLLVSGLIILVAAAVFAAVGIISQTASTQAIARAVTGNQPSSLPWFLTRASAITAYVLLFFIVTLGVGMTGGFIYKFINPVRAWTIHKYLGLAFGIMLLTHMASLLFDEYINFGVKGLLVPLNSSFKPITVSLGIVGFYLLAIVLITSLTIRLKMPRFWRATHYLVYPLFITAFIHGVYTGSDSATLAMTVIYWLTGIIFACLVVYRFAFHWGQKD